MIYPFSDWSFKRIFGREESKELLISFLNDLLEGERQIVDLTYLDKEQTPPVADMRGVIYDIYCQTDTGERIVVEMQHSYQRDFIKRAFAYQFYAIGNQLKRGEGNYEFSAVYVISFLNFELHNGKLKRFRTDFKMTDTLDHGNTLDEIRQIYLMLPLFRKELEECETNFDKWIYALKHMETITRADFLAKFPQFQKLADIADAQALNKEEYDKYFHSMLILNDNCSAYRTAMETGMEKGLKKGREEGRVEGEAVGLAKATIKNARAMKAEGLATGLIAKITGLSLEEIAQL